MYRILSIEGGGVRGIIPATILMKLEEEIQKVTNDPTKTLADYFDMIAGTSCGAILSCLYLLPEVTNNNKIRPKYSASEVAKVFKEGIPSIFVKTWSGLVWEGPEYKSEGLQKLAIDIAKDTIVSDLIKPIFIPTYDLVGGTPFYFSLTEHREYKVRDLIQSATAAPTFFAPVTLTSPNTHEEIHTLIDGGVFMNNPSYAALLSALDTLKKLPTEKRPSRIILASISCGCNNDKLPPGAAKWGKLSWISPLINISIDMNADIVDKQLMNIFDLCGDVNDYYRFDPPLKEGSNSIDNISPKNLEGLETDALNYVNIPEIKAQISNLAKVLTGK